MKPAIIVTGASTGIGRATALQLSRDGFHVFASVRRDADAETLGGLLGAGGQPLKLDVTDAASLTRAAGEVADWLDGRNLAGLVNNAGVALPGPALVQPDEEIERVIGTNLMGLIRSTRAFAPLLFQSPGPVGRIINVTSVSGRFAFPFTSAYAASKHAVEGYSASVRRELQLVGVDVIVVGPGSVRTPIWAKGAAFDRARLDGTVWQGPMDRLVEALARMDAEGLEPEAVAHVIARAMTAARPRARYAPVKGPLLNWWLPTLLPARWVDRIVAAALGLKRT